MICQFSFSNFRSYKNEATFDFQAADLPEFTETLLAFPNAGSLLPISVIYGPNGGGKTNVLQAISCLISIIVKPVFDLGKSRIPFIFQQQVRAEPFLFDDNSRFEPTVFEVFFRKNSYEYRYYISIFKDEIVSEQLDRRLLGAKKPARLFRREMDQIFLGSSMMKNNVNKSVNPKMPFLSFLFINHNIEEIVEVQEWFESCIVRNYAVPNAERQILIENDSKDDFIKLMNNMGIDITGFRLDDSIGGETQFYLQRYLNEKTYELPFSQESDGTKKLFSALPVLLLALKEGRFVVIDELDAKLHPKLLLYIINLFKNPEINKKGAQLLFTSHDISTMKNSVYRRDEIWFASANDNHESEIYSLYEIRRSHNKRINRTASFDKQYLEGRYGADPYLKSMLCEDDWK